LQSDFLNKRNSYSQAYDTLDYLHYVPYDELYAVLNNTYNNLFRFDYMPIIDSDLLREWPHSAMLAGRTENIPIITGCKFIFY
jgi:Carboxylesterase family